MRNIKIIIFLNLIHFQVGLLESMISALIPEMIKSYQLNYGLASVLPFAYFIALTLTCIPAGIVGSKYSPQKILFFAFLFALTSVFLFVLFRGYQTSIISLFVMGSAVAFLMVTSVPLTRKACGPENFAFYSTLNQFMYGLGAFFSPAIYSWLTINMINEKSFFPINILLTIVPKGFEWMSTYWIFMLSLLSLMVTVVLIRLPKQESANLSTQTGINKTTYQELFRNKYVFFYFISLVAYTSCEQGIAAWMSTFLKEYHGLDPLTKGASLLSIYWLLLTLGCFAGMILLKFFDGRKVLAGMALCAIISLFLALYGGTSISQIAFPLVALFESVMWPIIMALALNSVAKHHEVLSGFMTTACIGSAMGPVIIGNLGDLFGLGTSLHYLFIPLLVVLCVAFGAKPLVVNKRQSTE